MHENFFCFISVVITGISPFSSNFGDKNFPSSTSYTDFLSLNIIETISVVGGDPNNPVPVPGQVPVVPVPGGVPAPAHDGGAEDNSGKESKRDKKDKKKEKEHGGSRQGSKERDRADSGEKKKRKKSKERDEEHSEHHDEDH